MPRMRGVAADKPPLAREAVAWLGGRRALEKGTVQKCQRGEDSEERQWAHVFLRGPMIAPPWRGLLAHGPMGGGAGSDPSRGANSPDLAFAQQPADDEPDIGGTLAEAAHEVREPLLAEGDVHPNAVALRDERRL